MHEIGVRCYCMKFVLSLLSFYLLFCCKVFLESVSVLVRYLSAAISKKREGTRMASTPSYL